MWKQLISETAPDYTFEVPADPAKVQEAVETLGVQLPAKLADFYRETDGAFDEFGCHLIWPVSRLIKDNVFFRTFEEYKELYMPFDHLLFFSDNGCGDLFGYRILNGKIETEDIYVWNHEDDSRTWVAASLDTFITGLITGRIVT